MGTDTRVSCPVCSEHYDQAPEECFRCETPLGAWWRFEAAAARERPPEGARLGPIVGAAVAGALLAAIVVNATMRAAPVAAIAPVSAPPTSVAVVTMPAATPSAVPTAPAASALIYRVQPGDSLWRIAAALTGDGRNWRTLWPAIDPERPLAVGTELQATAPAR
jgi:nucleoid-associated protein YgaU